MDFFRRRALEFHPGDFRGFHQPVFDVLRQLFQGKRAHRAEHGQFHHFHIAAGDADNRALNTIGEGGDVIHRLLNLLIGLLAVSVVIQFNVHHRAALGSSRVDLRETTHTGQFVFNRQNHTLLHLRRRGTGIGNLDNHHVDLGIGYELLTDRQ